MRHLHTRTTRRRVVAVLTVLLFAVPAATPAAVADEQAPEAPALADGLALTPPMGFNNWNSTHCRAEFNESMVKGIADIFVEKGLKDAGYQYVNLDDCWALPARDAGGKLVPDPARFPNGIKAVADYVHSKGLKLGIYTSAGTKTCNSAGFPGALGHEYSDARQFADWGVDYLKYDNCNNQGVDAELRYTTMRDALKATGRPIVYSICEWGQNKPWEWAADVGHLWRTTGDISDTWGSMLSILKQNLPLAPHAGPGHWNDPDMLEVGNGGMTDTEYRSHFSMWSVMAAPLLIGSDLRSASDETFAILGNKEVIAVDQDPLGKQGAVVSSEGGRWVVAKEMKDGSRTVALFNESNSPQRIATTAAAVGLPAADAYTLRDLWQHRSYNTAGAISATVPAHGTVLVRVAADRRWQQHPPAVELGLDGATLVEAATPATLTTTVTDLGRTSQAGLGTALRPRRLDREGDLADHRQGPAHGAFAAHDVDGHRTTRSADGIVRPDAQGRYRSPAGEQSTHCRSRRPWWCRHPRAAPGWVACRGCRPPTATVPSSATPATGRAPRGTVIRSPSAGWCMPRGSVSTRRVPSSTTRARPVRRSPRRSVSTTRRAPTARSPSRCGRTGPRWRPRAC